MDEKIDNALLLIANKMAEAFAKEKTAPFLENFLNESGLARDQYSMISAELGGNAADLKKFTENMVEEHKFIFGRMLALSYAHGFIDKAQGKSIKTLIQSTKPQVKF